MSSWRISSGQLREQLPAQEGERPRAQLRGVEQVYQDVVAVHLDERDEADRCAEQGDEGELIEQAGGERAGLDGELGEGAEPTDQQAGERAGEGRDDAGRAASQPDVGGVDEE